jgi:predicted nucleic acid-binding protein
MLDPRGAKACCCHIHGTRRPRSDARKGDAGQRRGARGHAALRSGVVAQLAYWVRTKEGRQRQALQAWLTRLVEAMHGRIHGFNVSVAHVWVEQERLLEKAGQPTPIEDSYIAAPARRHGLTIVTGNDQDFRRPGLRVFNPFKELPNG